MTPKNPGRSRAVRIVLATATLGFAVHILLPQIGEVGAAFQTLGTGRWRYLGLALAGSVLTYVSSAWMVRASTRLQLPWVRTMLAQVAASLMAMATPAALGWVALTDSYLQKAGADEHTAHGATTLNMIITFLSHLLLLAVLVPLLSTVSPSTGQPFPALR